MEPLQLYIAYPEAYAGIAGLKSILNQNIISAESVGMPFLFQINMQWSQNEIDEAVKISGYNITYSDNIWTIEKS